MIRKSLLVLAVLAGISLSAAVKITSLPADQKNIEYWKIGNKYISAVISSQGGMLYQFSDKKSREEFVGKEGAFRDHFAPRNMAFATQLYQGKILESGPAKVVLELKAPQLEGLNQFNQITKTYTLEANASILNVSVRVYNQKESMTDAVYEYWCNSFLGPVQKNTDFLLPQADGILREKTGSNFFHTAPIAGWLGVIGKDSGVILLPDYKKFKLAYSWKCKGPFQRDTAEFRAVPEAIPAGSSTVYNYALAPFKGLDHLNGAGKSGCGKISVKGDQLTLQLAGFSPAKAQAVLLADNKECSRQNVDLTCGKINQYTFRLPGRCDKIQIEIRDTNGNLLFDLYQAVTKKARFLSRIQRNLPPRDNDVWQFDPKGDYKTAHFKWLDNKKKFDALILVEVTGSRDVIELQQRMNFNAEVPTLFPPSWTMSWRTKVAFTPGAPGDTGIDKLPPYLKKIMMSSSSVPAGSPHGKI